MKKKLLASLIAASMAAGIFAGCGSSASSGGSSSAATESSSKAESASESSTATTDADLTIGVVIWSTDDGLGADSKKALDTAADALGINLIYRTGSLDGESQTTDIENLIAAGVDGIMITTLVDSSTDDFLKICEDAGIPMQLMFRNIIDEEAYEYCMNSEYFAGYVVENEEAAGAAMVDKLVEDGKETIGLIYRENGNGVIDRRQEGTDSRIEELGLTNYKTIVTNTATAADASDATAQLTSAYPDINGLIMSSGSQGSIDGVITYLEGSNMEMTSFDTPADLKGSFDAGNLVLVVSGSQIDPMYALINLYKKVIGDPFQDTPTELLSNYIYLESADDVETYNKYFADFKTYTADEIVALTEMSYEEFEEEVSNYSLQTVVDKLG